MPEGLLQPHRPQSQDQGVRRRRGASGLRPFERNLTAETIPDRYVPRRRRRSPSPSAPPLPIAAMNSVVEFRAACARLVVASLGAPMASPPVVPADGAP